MSVRIAVEGCCHGELKQIYQDILTVAEDERPEILLICGDFQALRSKDDFNSISTPEKYKRLGDFHNYYSGVEEAPILTIFIGGNHEASNYLHELKYGGFVAKNIFFLGYSNVIWYKGLRIAGLSGIYKKFDYYKTHFETLPLNEKTVRSIYHSRFEDYLKISMIRNLNLNIFLTHDWPEGIVKYGNLSYLLKKKPFFKKDIDNNDLGSTPNMSLLLHLMPNYWFSAHLHVKFNATVHHNKRKLSDCQKTNEAMINEKNENEIELNFDEEIISDENKDEIDLDLEDFSHIDKEIKPLARGFSQTNFMALDKCLANRKYIEFLTIPITNEHESIKDNRLYYDLEFLKVLKWFDNFKKREIFKNLKVKDTDDNFKYQFNSEINEIKIDTDLIIPFNFEPKLENPKFQTDEFIKKFL